MTGLWRLVFVRACQTKIRYLQGAAVINQEIGSFHVAMEDFVLMQVPYAFEQLCHVALDFWFCEVDRGVLEEARQIVIHVGCYHEHAGLLSAVFRTLHSHLLKFEDVSVVQLFQELDLSQRRDRKAIFFIVHQDLLQCHDGSRLFRSCF
jgi:hypothetical protein